ncbi:MAG: isocitrate lyase/phosphoenolpyruvate mutase family protein [Bdellovibrionales bacterium]
MSSAHFSTRENLAFRNKILTDYPDVLTDQAVAALNHMARFNSDQKALMTKRMETRKRRAQTRQRITFLDESSVIPRTSLLAKEARAGKFVGATIPNDLKRQWIQGTGPAAKPNSTLEKSLRNVAYALLSGADGWMFDGEDALGQVHTMSLDNIRNLKLAVQRDPAFLKVAEGVAKEMNTWSKGFLKNEIVADFRKQLNFTTMIYRCRGLHLDDRHIREVSGTALAASIVDLTLYVLNCHKALQDKGSSIVLYLPKIQTAEEAALWNDMLSSLEEYLGLAQGTIKVYVLVEQIEATYQLMEIRAALGLHFVGFNTGRWDYINSVSDALAWDPEFVNPNIESITMTYSYMRAYEDRVRRAVNTADRKGGYALWQGGMEPNIPVGSEKGVQAAIEKVLIGAKRERDAGASGKWVAHWKMVHLVRPVWEESGKDNFMGRDFPPLTYTEQDERALVKLEEAPRTIEGARNLLSVALQYGNAFEQGHAAAALKPGASFGNDDILYLMEDMATGEIRVSILWEWLHKKARLTEADAKLGLKAGDVFTFDVFGKLFKEELEILMKAKDKDVHDDSKKTTLPIAAAIVEAYIGCKYKTPWYIDLLNICLDVQDLATAKKRIDLYLKAMVERSERLTDNLDFQLSSDSTATTSEADELQREVAETEAWMNSPRFEEIKRLYSARQVVEQRGRIQSGYPVAEEAATKFHARLRQLYSRREQISTFGPYSPGQAVAMKREGIEGIYLGGWATSAKGSVHEDPGPDLASYPLSQVPDEASTIVRALLTADRNQRFARARMSEGERKSTKPVDFTPMIIADADTGHGGDAHVRNLIRRFVEVGVPGYHIEDQKPGCKKCGHQGGKVLVPVYEQIIRLNTARFQLDMMRVPGLIVARTDAESASLLDGQFDERDQRFILGVTNVSVPSLKISTIALLKRIHDNGVTEVNGHDLFRISESEYQKAYAWMTKFGILREIDETSKTFAEKKNTDVNSLVNDVTSKFYGTWESEAGLVTFEQAVIDAMEAHAKDGDQIEMSTAQWREYISSVSLEEAKAKVRSMGLEVPWDAELARTPEGYYQIKGGIPYAIAKSLAVAPFCDLLWMETKTANLADAKQFADAIHAVYPNKMLAYNLSPSFNWDTTGMNDEEMKNFPKELGKMGFVFNFITYGGHQVDGLASEEFATALRENGMLALAKLQRRLRLLNSPYKTPQTLVGGPRSDGALVAVSGRTATTKAMGKGSTQHQHLVATEVPVSVFQSWLEIWKKHNQVAGPMQAKLRPVPSSELLELVITGDGGSKIADLTFSTIQDRWGKTILSVRDQNNYAPEYRKKRLVSLMNIFLLHRYHATKAHFLSPTEDNFKQIESMENMGVYKAVNREVGEVMVASVNREFVERAANEDTVVLTGIIQKIPAGQLGKGSSSTKTVRH